MFKISHVGVFNLWFAYFVKLSVYLSFAKSQLNLVINLKRRASSMRRGLFGLPSFLSEHLICLKMVILMLRKFSKLWRFFHRLMSQLLNFLLSSLNALNIDLLLFINGISFLLPKICNWVSVLQCLCLAIVLLISVFSDGWIVLERRNDNGLLNWIDWIKLNV